MNQKGSVVLVVLLLVLVLSGGAAYYFLVYQKTTPPSIPVVSNIIKPKLSLNLESPTDGSVITDNKVTVTGKTLPGATVVFYTETDQNSLEADQTGSFTGTVNLEYGINTLTVTAYDESGDEKSITLDIANNQES